MSNYLRGLENEVFPIHDTNPPAVPLGMKKGHSDQYDAKSFTSAMRGVMNRIKESSRLKYMPDPVRGLIHNLRRGGSDLYRALNISRDIKPVSYLSNGELNEYGDPDFVRKLGEVPVNIYTERSGLYATNENSGRLGRIRNRIKHEIGRHSKVAKFFVATAIGLWEAANIATTYLMHSHSGIYEGIKGEPPRVPRTPGFSIGFPFNTLWSMIRGKVPSQKTMYVGRELTKGEMLSRIIYLNNPVGGLLVTSSPAIATGLIACWKIDGIRSEVASEEIKKAREIAPLLKDRLPKGKNAIEYTLTAIRENGVRVESINSPEDGAKKVLESYGMRY